MKNNYTGFLYSSFFAIFFLLFVFIPANTYAQGWSELGTGSYAINANGYIRTITTDASGNVYAAGVFTNSGGKNYVAKWSGTNWVELGSGTNALNANSYISCIITDKSGNVYAAGDFTDGSSKRYVAKWNGTSWSEIGTGAGALNANSHIISIAIDSSNNIYAAGTFTDLSGYHYVAKWNGTNWTEIGALNANQFIASIALDNSGNVYATGSFTNIVGMGELYVAKWNGTIWRELDTSYTNLILFGNLGVIYTVLTDASGNVYAGGTSNAFYKWNGANWSLVGDTGINGLNANGLIYTSTMDHAGNIYIGGKFRDSANTYYIAKWNGTTWSELGKGAHALNADSFILSVAADASGNIYTSGVFTDGSNYKYVAKYTAPSGVGNINAMGCESFVYPNPVSGMLNINFCETGDHLLEVYNITGSRVGAYICSTKEFSFSCAELPAGLYFLKQMNDNGIQITKFIKE